MTIKNNKPVQRIWINRWDDPGTIPKIEETLSQVSMGDVIEIEASARSMDVETVSRYCHEKGYPVEVIFGSDSWRVLIQKGRHIVRTKVVFKNIRKSFATKEGRLNAMEGINLDIGEGEFVCIVGPSGCGKSTLLNILAGLESQDEGQILMDGKEVKKTGPDRLMIFQESALFPWLDVAGNIRFGLQIQNLDKDEIEERISKYLQMVHLLRFRHARIHELSGGMRQKVSIARALALEPDLLLMDEPFSALDEQTKHILHFELQEIWQQTKKTIIFVTHHLHEAICLADRVVLLSARPARIKKQYHIDLARPRDGEDIQVAMLAKQMGEELKEEVENIIRDET